MLKGTRAGLYLLTSFTLLMIVNTAFAEPAHKGFSTAANHAHKLDVYISGGPFSARLNNTSALQINSFVVNDYDTYTQRNWSVLGGGGIGHTFENIFHVPFNFFLGVAGYATSFGNIKGTEYPFINDDIYDTLNYQFYAQSSAAMIETRWIYSNYLWQPYALAGIGAAWNRLSDYNEVPTDPSRSAAPVSPTFSNHNNTAFAYELGVGLQRLLFEDTQHHVSYTASLDYRYVNFGKGQLGTMASETTGHVIQINNLSTQGAIFSLKVSFC